MRVEKFWVRGEIKEEEVIVVIRSKGKKVCERRVRNSIGVRIPSKGRCFYMFLLVFDVLYYAMIECMKILLVLADSQRFPSFCP